MIVKYNEGTDDRYGMAPEKRDAETRLKFGVVNIDKPSGLTSHEVSERVGKILNAKKAGHSGTLDPNVTGVLPVFLNESTKVIKAVLEAPKEYIALAYFHKKIDRALLNRLVRHFTGKIKQLPPVKSRVKRVERERTIYSINIMEFSRQNLLFRVSCQAGTYIRKLIHDFGVVSGVGASMTELRRTRAGPFFEDTLIKLKDLSISNLMPVEYAVSHLKKIFVSDSAVDSLCHGATLKVPGIVKLEEAIVKGELVALFTLKGELIATAHALMSSESIEVKSHGVAAKIERVIMPVGTYPKLWN